MKYILSIFPKAEGCEKVLFQGHHLSV